VIWSTAGLYARVIHVETPVLLFWRGLFGFLGMVGFMLWRGGPASLRGFVRMSRNGWLYALSDGLLRDLDRRLAGESEVASAAESARQRLARLAAAVEPPTIAASLAAGI
jgi:hypothetical protein